MYYEKSIDSTVDYKLYKRRFTKRVYKAKAFK